MRHTEIAIVGGGLAGSTAAAMLARTSRDFVVIDPGSTYPWDFRCEKLDPSQLALLRKTGLADIVLASFTQTAKKWTVRIGQHVQKRRTNQLGFYYDTLVNRLRAEIPTERFIVGKVASISISPDRQSLTLSDGERISARLVVMATGPNNALRRSLGMERKILSAGHSVSIGFDLRPVGQTKFDFEALTYFPERPSDPIAYLTLFPIDSVMRANLFVYHDGRDPWLTEFRSSPETTAFAAMPGLRKILGEVEFTSPIKIRPVDLYETTNYRQAGVVLVGDAFSSSCPAAGTGANKVFTDVERLCNVYIPRWIATDGMARDKIDAFYDDPDKQDCDAQSKAKALYMRSLSIDRSLPWRVRRLIKRIRGVGLGATEYAASTARSISWLGPN
jgi:2-polyprenyl-6-methoxyphenol hydroxylase-like FAD-dependent oxidoreductase